MTKFLRFRRTYLMVSDTASTMLATKSLRVAADTLGGLMSRFSCVLKQSWILKSLSFFLLFSTLRRQSRRQSITNTKGTIRRSTSMHTTLVTMKARSAGMNGRRSEGRNSSRLRNGANTGVEAQTETEEEARARARAGAGITPSLLLWYLSSTYTRSHP